MRASEYAFFRLVEGQELDLADLLRGTVEVRTGRRLVAVSALTRREIPVSAEAIALLAQVSSRTWTPVVDLTGDDPATRDLVDELLRGGLLVSDTDEPRASELRRRDERLQAEVWYPYAALYHFLAGWTGVDVEKEGSGARVQLDEFVETHGRPPPRFHSVTRQQDSTKLPEPRCPEDLDRLLGSRKTSRHLDPDQPITLDELATLLATVWGCRGTFTPSEKAPSFLKKTSPSGGSLHPMEVYPLVIGVEGLACGLYHYSVRDHALETIRPLEPTAARELAQRFVAGQSALAKAAVLFVMAARFYRNFWRYRRHPKAYGVLLKDAAHLSQTFYLVCTRLGLGAFYTAAINNRDAEDALGLDPYGEGVLGISGCGRPVSGGGAMDPTFEPWSPTGSG